MDDDQSLVSFSYSIQDWNVAHPDITPGKLSNDAAARFLCDPSPPSPYQPSTTAVSDACSPIVILAGGASGIAYPVPPSASESLPLPRLTSERDGDSQRGPTFSPSLLPDNPARTRRYGTCFEVRRNQWITRRLLPLDAQMWCNRRSLRRGSGTKTAIDSQALQWRVPPTEILDPTSPKCLTESGPFRVNRSVATSRRDTKPSFPDRPR